MNRRSTLDDMQLDYFEQSCRRRGLDPEELLEDFEKKDIPDNSRQYEVFLHGYLGGYR